MHTNIQVPLGSSKPTTTLAVPRADESSARRELSSRAVASHAGSLDVAPAGRRTAVDPCAVEHCLEPLGTRHAMSPRQTGRVVVRFTLNALRSRTSARALASAGESLTPPSITYSTNTLRRRSCT